MSHISSKKRSEQGGTAELIPDPSSSEDIEDSMLVVSDDGDDGNEGRHPALSPAAIDESMILSDEEDDRRILSGEEGDDEDHNERNSKPAAKKIWTGRNKKNHAHPVTAASSALMVDDKPWRKANKNRATTEPKSPGRIAQIMGNKAGALPSPVFQGNATTPTSAEAKRPLMKYIRGFGANSPPSPRRVRRQSADGSAPSAENWSDNEDDQSSVSSAMISYSSMESMDDSDDDMTSPLEDYTHHPEQMDSDFWNQLPYVPSHFVHDLSAAELSSMVGITSNASSAGCLAYLDPQLKELTENDPSKATDFLFALDHRFFLRAVFQLLAERDEVGVEDSIHDDQNIIKKGPLRKKYLGKVKVKYLELRKGNLTYFGDDDGEGRKTVHLRSATASCNAVDGILSESDKDPNATFTFSTTPTGPSASVLAGSHAATALSAGITSAVNATTSAASTFAGGTGVTAGFEFHLWVDGKRYAWLANSRNEQQGWVRAIRQAMIGDKVDDNDWGMTLNTAITPSHSDDVGATHEEALGTYQELQSVLSSADSEETYLESIRSLIQHPGNPSVSPALHIPLKCLSDQMPKDKTDPRKDGASQQRRVKTSIAEFWNNLRQFDFSINGHLIDRDSPYAAERTIGALVRCILDFDRCFAEGGSTDPIALPSVVETPGQSVYDRPPQQQQQKRSDPSSRISELDAVSYARSILRLIIKSKTSGDVEFAIENLLRNDHLVMVDHIDPSSALSASSETLHIDVSFAGDDVIDHDNDSALSNEASGWVMVRRSKYNSWKSRFCVFSEGVFSYYENAQPRPHGLRGQLLLSGASISVLEDEKDRAREDAGLFILRLTTKGQERERQFAFKSEDEFLEWKAAIEHVVEACDATKNLDLETEKSSELFRESTGNKKSMGIIGGGSKLVSYATDESLKAIKSATDSSMKVVKGGTKVIKDATGAFKKGATNLMFRSIRSSSRSRSKRDGSDRAIKRAPSLQFLMERTRSESTGKREPTVQCVIQTTCDFKVKSVTSTTEADENIIVTTRVKFLQAYLLSGGKHGRMARGDATIEIDFIDETVNSTNLEE